ncbi:MAG: hypothetical protein NW208_00900 [Bryobacter sp.]|nr:hypothetical protein [Bryobacter sp.]
MSAPTELLTKPLKVGDYTIEELASMIVADAKSRSKEQFEQRTLWALRLAFVSGCQRGHQDAHRTAMALIDKYLGTVEMPI